jgi:hypothetical protein
MLVSLKMKRKKECVVKEVINFLNILENFFSFSIQILFIINEGELLKYYYLERKKKDGRLDESIK